jgi:hypothetical protein
MLPPANPIISKIINADDEKVAFKLDLSRQVIEQ